LIPWLKSLQEDQAEVRRYEFCPLVRIQGWSDLPPGTPLFESLLAFENYPIDRSLGPQAQGSLQIGDIRLEERVNYPLAVIVSPASSLSVRVLFHLDRFRAEDIRSLLDHFQRLLLSLGANPDRRLDELSLLSPGEQEQILVAWNQTSLTVPGESSAHELFEIQAGQRPEGLAVVDGERHISYGELNRRANQLAHYLRAVGVGPEVLVGVCLHRSLEMVMGILGILKAGGVYLPLDPSTPTDRLDYMLRDCAAAVVLTTRALAERQPDPGAKQVCLDADWKGIAREGAQKPPSEPTMQNLAYVIYTSGSTGRPKGVAITHEGLANLVQWHRTQYGVEASDRATQLAGLSFDASVWELWPYLTAGASIHLVDEKTRSSPTHLVEWLLERSITLTFLPTPLAESVLKESWPTEVPLRGVLTGGDQLHRAPESTLPFELWNHYGPTEDSVVTTRAVVSRDAEGAPPIGGPIHNKRVYVLDQYGDPVPVGVTGELCIAGIGLARGYLGRPEWTAEKFVADPYSEKAGSRLYRTGDVVRWRSDGQLEFVGRDDRQVKIRGYRVELGEIETLLAEHPLVRQAVVTLREARNGSPSLVAHLVVAADEDAETPVRADEFRSFLSKMVPDYMVPSYFVLLESLPLTLSGKVDRKSLPPPGGRQLAGYVPPRTPLEATLTGIWAEVMRIERVGVHDDFFELGGHSILAVQLMGRITEKLGQTVPLADFLERPTIERMAGLLEQLPVHPRLVTFKRCVGKRPVFFVHSGSGTVMSYYSLAQRMHPDQPFYGLEARGLDGRQEPLETIEQMASDYIDAVRCVQPRGPYFLGGHSAGGIVAFEMARQLRAGGDNDVRLLLLDTPSPHFYHGEWADAVGRRMEADEELLATVARDFGHPAGKPFPISPTDPKALTQDDRIALLLRGLQGEGLVPPDAKSMEALLRVSRGIYRALLRYEPPAPDPQLQVRLFRAAEDNTMLRDEEGKTHPTWGWEALVGEVIVTKVGGDHFSMLSEPHVGPLSGLLTAALEPTR
jgi:microcystin synthetase protein McyB